MFLGSGSIILIFLSLSGLSFSLVIVYFMIFLIYILNINILCQVFHTLRIQSSLNIDAAIIHLIT